MQPLTLKERFRLMPFRFVVLYLTFYIWPFPIFFIPGANFILAPLHEATTKIIDVTGAIAFGEYYNPVHVVTGSGDTSYDYARVLLFFISALIISFVWSILDGEHDSYKKLPIALNILVQFYLAAILLSYGFQKVFPLQFPPPPSARLAQTYGESSPMGLLWTFMGSSRLYSAFTGACEVLAGVGLLFRRTKLLAAVLAAFIFLHILILNLSYDVPVKLYSFHLFLMTFIIIQPHAQKIINAVTINNTPLILSESNAVKYRWIFTGLKIILIYFIFAQPLFSAFKRNNEIGQSSKQPVNEILGTYKVLSINWSSSTQNNHAPAPQWKEIKLNDKIVETIYTDGVSLRWHSVLLKGSQTLRMASKDLSNFGELKFRKQKKDLLLVGTWNQDSIIIKLQQISPHNPYDLPLLNREFHWISEEPFNR